MYKQNGSPDTCFEALIVRVPWPDFVERIERERYDNAKFLPVQLVDYTSGYDSECAVLFPETFSIAERPPTTSARSSATASGPLPALAWSGADVLGSTCRRTPWRSLLRGARARPTSSGT